MIAPYLSRLLQSVLAVCLVLGLVAGSPSACVAGPPVWQPYRQLPAPRPIAPQPMQRATQQAMQRVDPAQFHVLPHERDRVTNSHPVDAITDADLDQLDCYHYQQPGVTNGPFLDPIIANSTNHSSWGFAQPNNTLAPGDIELLPSDVIWHSYWAGAKEPRTSGTIFRENSNNVSLLDVSLGGRTSVLRNAVRDDRGLWQGWEVQIEGAAMLRLNLDEDWDFDSTDFRFGVPLILAQNQLHWKLAYYHLSSHVGDEFLVRNPGFTRINFSRDVLVFGASFFPRPAWRWYGEIGWAFYDDEGSDPWELQFGVDYAQPGPTGKQGTPFLAANGHLREEVDFGGNLSLQAGWLWRGQAGRILRTGLHYYNGKSSQFEFFDNFEQHVGVGLWQEY